MSWLGNIAEKAILSVVKRLPQSIQVRIKQKIKVVVKSPDGDFYMGADNQPEFKRRNIGKEPETVEWIEENVNKNEVFYDIGACVGGYALLAAKRGAEVYAFEAGYASFAALCRNAFLNPGFKITPFYVVLLDKNGIGPFHYSSLEGGRGCEHSTDSELILAAPFARLDDFARFYRLPPPDHVKIDVDGAEGEVISGAKESLKRAKTIMLEMREGSAKFNFILSELESIGFKASQKWRRSLNIYNYLFLKQ